MTPEDEAPRPAMEPPFFANIINIKLC